MFSDIISKTFSIISGIKKADSDNSVQQETASVPNKSASLNMQPSAVGGRSMVVENKDVNIRTIYPNINTLFRFHCQINNFNERCDKNLWHQRAHDLRYNLVQIKDEKAIDYINKIFEKKNFCYKDFEDIELLSDSINSYNEIYSPYIGAGSSKYPRLKSPLAQFADLHEKSGEKTDFGDVISGDKSMLPNYVKNSTKRIIDFQADASVENRIYGLKNYLKQHVNTEISEYLYNDYYLNFLKEQGTDSSIISELKNINEKFGVKVCIGLNLEDGIVKNALNIVKSELNVWNDASDGTVKYPPVIDFSSAKTNWYDLTSAYGQYACAGFCEPYYNGALAFSRMDNPNLVRSLRHEITHANDLKHGKNIDAKYNLNDIMPKKVVDGKTVVDFEKCKYKEELLNAGISKYRVKYAYNNTEEFIAIASEGNIAEYSDELKRTLVDFGMPEWMINMPPVCNKMRA